MLRGPLRSTLFPYTTLFRSSGLSSSSAGRGGGSCRDDALADGGVDGGTLGSVTREPDARGPAPCWRTAFSTAASTRPKTASQKDRKSTRLNSSHSQSSYAGF